MTAPDIPDADLLAGVRDGDYLNRVVLPPLAWPVPGLIPEGMTLLVGPPKAGKSALILDFLLAVAAGGRALGRLPVGPARRVFYLALEDGDRRMQDRCRHLSGGDIPGWEDEAAVIPALFSYQTAITPGSVLATVRAWMELHPDTAMVVIDTLGRVMPPALYGESSYNRDYRVGHALKTLADDRPGLAVVVLHHDRKAFSDDFVDSVSGTHGLAGAADTVAVLCRPRHSEHAVIKITGKDVAEDEYALKIIGGRAWQLDGADLKAAATAARERAAAERAKALSATSASVLAFVGKHPDGVTTAAVVAEFGSHAGKYLTRLAEADRIIREGRGLYKPLPEDVSEVSEVSQAQVSGPEISDTAILPLSEVSETPAGPGPRSDTSDTGHGPVSEIKPPLTSQSDTSDTKDRPSGVVAARSKRAPRKAKRAKNAGASPPPLSLITGDPIDHRTMILCEICGQTHDPAGLHRRGQTGRPAVVSVLRWQHRARDRLHRRGR